MSNRRIREKQAVKRILKADVVMFPDIHGKEPRLLKKCRLAVERQIARGERSIKILGDCFE